jgi:hypothetical protein
VIKLLQSSVKLDTCGSYRMVAKTPATVRPKAVRPAPIVVIPNWPATRVTCATGEARVERREVAAVWSGWT